MTDPYEPPRPRDYALQEELESLREQEREGHGTPKEHRRAEQLERVARTDRHATHPVRHYADTQRAHRVSISSTGVVWQLTQTSPRQ